MLSLVDLKIKFLVRFPNFKDIFDRIDLKIDDSLATACTDGYTLFFSSEYMSSLSEDQQLFVFSHELLHVALEHIIRSEGKNHKNWNMATDAVINAYLKKCGIQSPDNLVEIANALNYSAEQLYEKLQKEDEEKKDKKDRKDENIEDSGKKGGGTEEIETSGSSNNNDKDEENKDDKSDGSSSDSNNKDNENDEEKNKDGNGNSSSNDSFDKDSKSGFDDHSRWKDGLDRYKKEKQEKESKGQNESSDNKNIDERDEFSKNDKLKDRLDDDFVRNPSDSMKVGNGHGSGRRRIDDSLGDTKAINWQRLLRESVRTDYDYDSSTLEEDESVLINPFEPYEKPKTEIVIDCSGSIDDTLIRNFLNEALTIVNNSEAKVGFFDTKFSGFTRVRNEQDIKNIDIPCGGGTDFNVAVGAFTKRADNKIIFTDGYSSMPKEYCNAIWVVVGYHPIKINPPGGKVIYIGGEQYRNLCENRRGKSR